MTYAYDPMRLTAIENKLLGIAFEDQSPDIQDYMMEEICDDTLGDPRPACGWPCSVDHRLLAIWGELDLCSRLVAYVHASRQVSEAGDDF